MKVIKNKRLWLKLRKTARAIKKVISPVASVMAFFNPFRYIKKMDRYIIGKFIGTYIYSIILIISRKTSSSIPIYYVDLINPITYWIISRYVWQL